MRWFTNLDHGKRHHNLQLMTMAENRKFNKKVIDSDVCYKSMITMMRLKYRSQMQFQAIMLR